ncbi:MAG: hypothetical protein KBD21_03025 [Candidatus Pacebacteria bacterium]|nr:hypothetical protein [Candidatus Paceibacterota bacterium]
MKQTKQWIFIIIACVAVFPDPLFVRSAGTITDILNAFAQSLGGFVTVGVALALCVFVWGLVRSIYFTKSDTELADARKQMVWGIVGLTVVVSVWGFVKLLQTLVGVENQDDCTSPTMEIGESITTKSCF